MNQKPKLLKFAKRIAVSAIITFSCASFFFINQVQSLNTQEQIEFQSQPFKQDLKAVKSIALKIRDLIIIIS